MDRTKCPYERNDGLWPCEFYCYVIPQGMTLVKKDLLMKL